jgi:colanic acid/amylovoran biosynthesis glycosyltransferase
MALEKENLAQAIGAKMAVSFRGFDYYVYPLKHPHCYRKLFSKAARYHVLSESMKEGLVRQGISENKILKITPAIDINQFRTSNNPQPQQDLKIVTVARLHWIKGLEATLEALALVKQKGIRFQYTIIGDGPEKERLQFAAYQLGLTDTITFTGKLAPEEVKIALEQSDLYLQYSIQEGFCNAVLEAQAMGKLCIVSDAEGLAENVVDGWTGFVVPKRNPVSLCEKIVAVFQLSENKKAEIRNQAISRVRESFTIEKQLQEFIQFYD